MPNNHIQRIQETVRSGSSLRPVGGGSKPALSAEGNLSLAGLSGVLEYEPSEYTFTALAGTPLHEVETLLGEHGQYLPFDPPFAGAGATLGGTAAAGLSGPGRFRYGGVRDFLLGVTFVSGEGKLVTGGGKVVKNAAGFDFPKLMVGSLGAFGVLVELTFKVFPRPEAYATLDVDMESLEDAVTAVQKLAVSPFEPACLDFEPSGRLFVRIGGTAAVLGERLGRIQALIGREGEILKDDADEAVWREAREFAWVSRCHNLVKVPLNPQRVEELERALEPYDAPRRYSVGGNVLWLAWPEAAGELERLLSSLNLSALALTGTWETPLLGVKKNAFMERILSVLDPEGKFALEGAYAA